MIHQREFRQALLVMSFLLAATGTMWAQPDLNKLFNSQPELVQRALDSALYIVRQDYVLRDTSGVSPVDYGRTGNNYFGRSYTLGVMAGGELYVTEMDTEPWTRDSNYAEFAMDSAYIPSLSTISLRAYGGGTFTDLPVDVHLKQNKTAGPYKLTGLNRGEGLTIYSVDSSAVEGLYLNVTSKRQFAVDESQEPHLSISFSDVQLNGEEVVRLPGQSRNQLPRLGGLYLIPDYSVGSVTFSLLGLVDQDNGALSVLPLPRKKKRPADEAEDAPVDDTALVFQVSHEDGFPLQSVLITVEGEDLLTDENGRVSVYPQDAEKVFTAQLNGAIAGCGKSGQVVVIICRYRKGIFLPAKKIKCP